MQLTRRDLLAGGAGALAVSSLPTAALAQGAADARAGRLLDEMAERLLALKPEEATGLGIDKGARAALKSRLVDKSAAGQRRIADSLRADVQRLRAVERDALSPAVRTNVEVAEAGFVQALDGFAFPYGDVAVGSYRQSPYVVIQNVGAFLDTPKLLENDHRVETRADAEAYLARMRAYARQLDGETERLRRDRGLGVIAPDFLLDKALRQIKLARSGPVEQWVVVRSLADRTKSMSGGYAAKAAAIATAEIAPALDRQIAELTEHRDVAGDAPGVSRLPRGDEYYAWALRAGTTTRMSADEVHRMGLEELRALEAQMDPILRSIGYTQGTVGARMTALGKDPRFGFPDTDAGRAAIMELMRGRISAIKAMMPRAFNTLVRGNVEVKRLPLAEEPGAPGAFGGAGSIDGTVPSRVWLNLRTTKIHTRYSLPTLAYHEGIPGHGWQGEYSFKLPLIRTLLNFNAYKEGWALYSEQIADELGVYAENPVERLGYLQALAFRASRLVVDTGLHAKDWTRAQAIDWFSNATGQSVDEVSGEVDRYCAWPGQACGYKVGHSFINRLRDRAKGELGPRYDWRAFNDAVVMAGDVPLTVLEAVVARHVAGRRA